MNETELKAITEQLKLLTAAIEKQNELLQSCILKPDDQPARFLIGTVGVVETINF